MKFTQITEQEFFKEAGYKKTKLAIFVQEFIDANIPTARVDWENSYSSASSCQSAITECIKRMKATHIKVVSSGGKVFMYNDLLMTRL